MKIYEDSNGLVVRALGANEEGDLDYGNVYEVSSDKNDKNISKLDFQKGPINVHGVNGLTFESLLSVMIHRLNLLNSKFHCKENDLALSNMQSALDALLSRTKDRSNRGIVGKEVA